MKKRRISITLTENLLDKYTKIAKEAGISRNALIAIVLKDHLMVKEFTTKSLQ